MKYELEKSEKGDFTTYPFLGKVERKEIPQFTTILKSLILNLRVRFDSVSFSLDKKNVKKYLNYDQMCIMQGAPSDGGERCGIYPLLDVFHIRKNLVPRHLSTSLSHLGLMDEWSRLVPVLSANWDNLVMSCFDRENDLTEKEKEIRQDLRIPFMPNLLDVFSSFEKHHSQDCGGFS